MSTEKLDQRYGPALEAMYVFVRWLVPTVEKFPRSQKFLLGDRLQAQALDVLELLIEATWSRRREGVLERANLGLEKLRHLIRLTYDMRYLDARRYERCILATFGLRARGWIFEVLYFRNRVCGCHGMKIHKNSWVTAIVLFPVFSLAPAQADLLPPGDFLLRERMKEPGFYDEADQFCRAKPVGAPCSLPGHAFDGGGDGRCQRRLEALGRHAQLICTVKPAYTIDRQLPASPYQFSPTACWAWTHDKAFRERMTYLNARCEPAPVAADRFCKGKQANEACSVEITLQGRQEQRPGRCELDTDRFDFDPPRVMSRPRMLCQSATSLQREIRPASPPDSGNASN